MKTTKNYFFQAFVLVVISAGAFIAFKSILPNKIMEQAKLESKNIVIDSLLLDAIHEDKNEVSIDENDTLLDKKNILTPHLSNRFKYNTENFESYKGYQYIEPFYEKLLQLERTKSGSVRIAYFGDSMIDGDMIVQDIRKMYQDQFGGQGVGFVSITSESASSRATIKHEFSPNWKTQSYLKTKNPIAPFGVNGHVFFANDSIQSTWAKFKASNYKYLTQLNNPTLFYGKSSNREAMISYVIGKDTIYKKLNPINKLNTLKLADNLKNLKVNFINAENIPIYGFNFDDGNGVHVDNFSNRGNSGLPISLFDVSLMQEFDAKLKYDLVVLHYGTNVLNYGSYDYSWYEKRMAKVVQHIKKCFPSVAILIISTADKSSKYDLQMKTDSAVIPLAKAQKKYAIKSEAGFVNLYTLMGGNGSMVQWVEAEPSMANKDYTHFNYLGSIKIAKLIYGEINTGYLLYKQLNNRMMPPKLKNDSVSVKIDSTNE